MKILSVENASAVVLDEAAGRGSRWSFSTLGDAMKQAAELTAPERVKLVEAFDAEETVKREAAAEAEAEAAKA